MITQLELSMNGTRGMFKKLLDYPVKYELKSQQMQFLYSQTD